MNIALWIVAGLLALAYLGAGGVKIIQPKEKLVGQMGWVENASTGLVKFVGAVEVLGAIGLILPQLTGVAPILTPLAALGLVLIQIGAIVVHIRRAEIKNLPVNIVLLLLAAFVMVFRFAG
ncbi:DoxX family protein [Psychromicrobium sp. YIM B11713]|uniref:DoxX family protein n=1 Tax=Psychromicrobium sp. YIM B11713 TaxID=3145233 RepID=UPI00374F83FC